MSDFDWFYQAIRDLFIAGVAYTAYKMARDSEASGPRTAWHSLIICLVLAGIAFGTAGDPSCAESDPIRGTCLEYNDDGYEVAVGERYERAGYLLALLLIPAVIGSMNKPSRSRKQRDDREQHIPS